MHAGRPRVPRGPLLTYGFGVSKGTYDLSFNFLKRVKEEYLCQAL